MRTRALLTVIGVTSALALSLTASAEASITVANQNDSGPGSLRQAVADAPPAETIVLPAGTYTLASTLTVEKSLTIAGHAAADTIIRSGGGFRVIEMPKRTELELSDVTIRDGNASSAPFYGGGVFSMQGNLILRRVEIDDNVVDAPSETGVGGGVAVTNGSLELIESIVTDNTVRANGASGAAGGTAVGAGIYAGGPLKAIDSTISGNTAEAKGGPGPSSSSQKGGTADGGGLFVGTVTTGATKVTDSTIAGNVADASPGAGGEGGTSVGAGLSATSTINPATVLDSTIVANVARISGTTGTVVGGGAYLGPIEPGGFTVLGATITANRVEGGAVGSGGNLYLNSTVGIRNSIVSGGAGPSGLENCGGAGVESLGFNLDSLNQCAFSAQGDKINANPLLGPLQNNGGATQTMLPAATSPAVDQGIAVRPTDQRGVVRPIDFPSIANAPGGDGSDIGAVELQPSNAISLGAVKLDKKKGIATVAVTIPAPSAGTLTLVGAGLNGQSVAIVGQASVTLQISAKGAAAKSLRKKGKRKVSFEVTYTPTGNAAVTKSGSTTLKRKPKHRPKRHKHKPKKH